MRRCVIVMLICAGIGCRCLCSEESDAAVSLSSTNLTESVGGESYLQLKAENDALRRENQILRRELVAKGGALPETLLPEKAVAPAGGRQTAAGEEDTGYWISAKSKIRHNWKCRNYKKVKGRPCGPNDGKPCKSCGG